VAVCAMIIYIRFKLQEVDVLKVEKHKCDI